MSTNIEIIIGTYEEFLLGYKYELKVSRKKDLKQLYLDRKFICFEYRTKSRLLFSHLPISLILVQLDVLPYGNAGWPAVVPMIVYLFMT